MTPTVIQPAVQKPIAAALPPVEPSSAVEPLPSVELSPSPVSEYPKTSSADGISLLPSVHVSLPVTSKPAPKYTPKPVKKSPNPAAKSPTVKAHKSSPSVVGSSGSHWCITYSPYNADGSCKDEGAVSSDIATIAAKGFTSIRLYSTDCSGLHHVGAAVKSHGLNLVLGIYISDSGIADAEQQINEIIAWTDGDWGCVEMIVVGNEAVFNEYCTPDALVDVIKEAKAAFQEAGYSGPITTTEPINVLREHAATLCPILDVVAANIHPFFNSGVTAETAGDFVAKELQHLQSVCPGLVSYNLETGWPSAGVANGAAVPGTGEQQAAIISILKAAGSNSVFFSFVDDLWKAEGEFGV